jgi:hypothetical protein
VRLFLDSDVLLDVLLERLPNFTESAAFLDHAPRRPGRAGVAWHSLANLHYLMDGGAEEFIGEFLDFVEVPATGSAQLRQALELGLADLEDAMVASAAILFGAQIIVTRNTRDYRNSPVRAVTPREAVKLLDLAKG